MNYEMKTNKIYTFQINVLILNLSVFYMFRTSYVHLQEDHLYVQFYMVRFSCVYVSSLAAGIAQSVERLATGWMARGKIFRSRTDRPWGPPSLLYNGYRVFPGGKAAGAWC